MSRIVNIPDWIKDFRYEGYTNAFEKIKDCPRLYATETLYGDWDAEVLLLAKDAAPAHVIYELFKKEGKDAWRHAQRRLGDKGGVKTNERLDRLVKKFLPELHKDGNLLYGSALANLLFNEPNWTRPLPGIKRGALFAHLGSMLKWVIEEMPNLRVIGCLGEDSWHLTSSVLGDADAAKKFKIFRDESQIVSGTIKEREIKAVPLYHPAAHIDLIELERNWGVLSGLVES